jgi:hypothetical protein
MNASLRQRLAPARVWPLAMLLALGIIALAVVFCPGAEVPDAIGNPLVYANGEAVPDGRWSVLCIDGIAYLEIDSARGHRVVPKFRSNGRVARCALPAGE